MDNYYDDKPHQEKGERRSWVIPLLLGIIIGVLIVTVAIPQYLSNKDQTPQTEQLSKLSPGQTDVKQVSVDVVTQVTDVVEDVSPAVVGVTNIQQQSDFWRQQEVNEAGTGSGVIYKISGDYAYVVTNHHVIEGADAVEVVLMDETNVEAKILGSDIFTDLAVLQMDSSHVKKAIEMGKSSNIKAGEPAIAIGNPLGHMFSGSVTLGVISGTERTIPVDIDMDGQPDWQAEVIQTDAAINPGNSGGALINIQGQLIGINSMKINQAAVEGIGFAIPVDAAQPIISELEENGEVVRPYLGVEIYSLDEIPKVEWERTLKLPKEVDGGVYIWSIEPFSPADKGGLRKLDVITEINGHKILNTIALRKILYQQKGLGDEISIVFYRDGVKQETKFKLDVQQ